MKAFYKISQEAGFYGRYYHYYANQVNNKWQGLLIPFITHAVGEPLALFCLWDGHTQKIIQEQLELCAYYGYFEHVPTFCLIENGELDLEELDVFLNLCSNYINEYDLLVAGLYKINKH